MLTVGDDEHEGLMSVPDVPDIAECGDRRGITMSINRDKGRDM